MRGLQEIQAENVNAEREQLAKAGFTLHTRGQFVLVNGPELYATLDATDRYALVKLRQYANENPHRLPPRMVELVEEHAKQFQPKPMTFGAVLAAMAS